MHQEEERTMLVGRELSVMSDKEEEKKVIKAIVVSDSDRNMVELHERIAQEIREKYGHGI